MILFLPLIAALTTVGAGTANAEPAGETFFEIYGGVAMSGDDTVAARKITTNFVTVTDQSATRNVSYDASGMVGGRIGTFVDTFGLAFDMSYFEANDPGLQNSIFSVSGLLMARARLMRTGNMPEGRLQPYFAIGPGYFIVNHDVDYRPDISRKFEFHDSHFGLDARAGLRWLFSRNIGLLVEYRLTHFAMDSVNDTVKINGEPTERVDGSLTTHHLSAGLTFYF